MRLLLRLFPICRLTFVVALATAEPPGQEPDDVIAVNVLLERIAGSRRRLYQFTAIDDCTRIRVLKIYDVCNQKSAISFVDEVSDAFPSECS
jgi:hypothetical protein